MTISTGDSVTFEYTAKLRDGPVFDTTSEQVASEAGLDDHRDDTEYGPVTIEVGAEEIIEGLDEALIGMAPQEESTIKVPPEKGFGNFSEEKIQEYDTEDFAQMMDGQPPQVGMHVRTQRGDLGEITHADDETVRIDFNHQLAGETLEFDIEIVDVN